MLIRTTYNTKKDDLAVESRTRTIRGGKKDRRTKWVPLGDRNIDYDLSSLYPPLDMPQVPTVHTSSLLLLLVLIGLFSFFLSSNEEIEREHFGEDLMERDEWEGESSSELIDYDDSQEGREKERQRERQESSPASPKPFVS